MFDPSEAQWAKAELGIQRSCDSSSTVPHPISEKDLERFFRLIRGVLSLFGLKIKESGGILTLAREISEDDNPQHVEADDEALMLSMVISDCWSIARDACSTHRSNQIRLLPLLTDASRFIEDVGPILNERPAEQKIPNVWLQTRRGALFASQFCCNCVASDPEAMTLAWESHFPHTLLRMLYTARASQYRRLVGCCLAFLHTMIARSKKRAIELANDRSLCLVILKCAVVNKGKMETPEHQRTSSPVSGPYPTIKSGIASCSNPKPLSTIDPALEWVLLIAEKWTACEGLEMAYHSVGVKRLNSGELMVTPEQLVLLHLVEEVLDSLVCEMEGEQSQDRAEQRCPNFIIIGACQRLLPLSSFFLGPVRRTHCLQLLVNLLKEAQDNKCSPPLQAMADCGQKSSPEANADLLQASASQQMADEARSTALRALGGVLGSCGPELRESAVTAYDVVELATELLKDCKERVESQQQPLCERGKRGEGGSIEARDAEVKGEVDTIRDTVDAIEGHKADVMRVLANACYRCPHAQEKARIRGTIPLVLSYCATDPRNPMLREWGLMTIRNLCEDCPENQAFISELELQATNQTNVQESALEAAGMRVRVDQSTGKLVVDRGGGSSSTE